MKQRWWPQWMQRRDTDLQRRLRLRISTPLGRGTQCNEQAVDHGNDLAIAKVSPNSGVDGMRAAQRSWGRRLLRYLSGRATPFQLRWPYTAPGH